VSKQQEELKEYRQGDTVRLTVEMRDPHGVGGGFARAVLEGSDYNDPFDALDLTAWAEGTPPQAEFVLHGAVSQQPPGVYECDAIVGENPYHALSRHDLEPPLRFRIVEHPDDVREGPEILSVGTFW
jgi:hypothetical protein